ncbi:hypothetical protein Tco_0445796 [Tanacetum coccineum]
MRGKGGKIQKQNRNTTKEEGSSSQVNRQSDTYWKKFNIWYRKLRRHKQVLKTENPSKRIAFLENEHSKSFAKWLRKEVERDQAGLQRSVPKTNSRVSVGAIDLHISKEVATTRQAFYYVVLQEIWVLDYRFRQIPLFKCDWVNHRAGGVKRDNLSLHIAFAACICTLHLYIAFASKHLHIAFADCICTLHLYIAFASKHLHIALAG